MKRTAALLLAVFLFSLASSAFALSVFGIQTGDSLDKAAFKIQQFLPEVKLKEGDLGYTGTIDMLDNQYALNLFNTDTGNRVFAMAIDSPTFSTLDSPTAFVVAFQTLREACIFQLGKPENEILVVDPDGENEHVTMLEIYRGMAYIQPFYESEYDARIYSLWGKDVYLVAEKNGNKINLSINYMFEHQQ